MSTDERLRERSTAPDYATVSDGTEHAEAIWYTDSVAVRASLGVVNLLKLPHGTHYSTRICRFPDAMRAALAAADGAPVHWVEYRGVSLGAPNTGLDAAEDSALRAPALAPELGFDVLDPTFDLNRVQQWMLLAYQVRRPANSVLERRVWPFLSAPGPWMRQRPPALAPWSQL